MRMRRRFAVHLRYILYAIIGVFVLTLPAIFSGGGSRMRQREDGGPAIFKDTIAEVNGTPITRGDFERVYRRTASEITAMAQVTGYAIGIERLPRGRLDAFDEAVIEHLVMKEAERQGISVSNRQVGKRAAELAKQQLDQFKLQMKGRQLEQYLAGFASANDGQPRQSMSERSFLGWFTKFLTDTQADNLRAELLTQALEKKVTGSITATEKELLASCDEAGLREIVVALRPPAKPERTDEQARTRAEEILGKAKQGADFAQLARTESDDEEAKYDGGLQPTVPIVHLSPAYQKAVAALKAGDLVPQPIKTDHGYTVVKVETRERKLPEEYEKNKQQYLKDFTERKRRTAWQQYQQQLREKAQVKVSDPEILGYQEIQQGHLDKALPLLQEATATVDQLGGLATASVYYELAITYSVQNKWKEAADAYAAANDALSGEHGIPQARSQALIGMARCYENLGQKEDAAKWYQVAGEASDVASIHEQLLYAYQRLGNAELVKQEQQWMEEYQRQEQERARALQEQQRKMEEEAAKKRPRPAPAAKP